MLPLDVLPFLGLFYFNFWTAAVIALFVAGVIYAQTQFFKPNQRVLDRFKNTSIGHRGGGAHRVSTDTSKDTETTNKANDTNSHTGSTASPTHPPENTLSAFREGHKMGFTSVEFDIQMTKDGVPVVFHDTYIGRTLKVDKESELKTINDLTYAELKKLRFLPERAGEQYRDERVPTMYETFDECSRLNLDMMIELKSGPKIWDACRAVVSEIGKRKLYDRCFIASFNPAALVYCRYLDKRVTTTYLVASSASSSIAQELTRQGKTPPAALRIRALGLVLDSILRFFAHPITMRFLGIGIIAMQHTSISAEIAQMFHRWNIPVLVWTVNDALEHDHWIRSGISCITDFGSRIQEKEKDK